MMRFHFLWMAGLALNLASFSIAVATELVPSKLQLFVGKNQTFGTQLWQTDNTTANTKIFSYLLKTPNADSNYYPIGKVGKYGIFAAFTPETGQELWRTDGSSEGTQLLKDIAPGASNGLPRRQPTYITSTSVNLKDRLIFWGRTTTQLQLYSTDGSPENTQVLASFPFETELPNLYLLNEQAFFWVNDGIHGVELWQTDGNPTGTKLTVNASLEQPAELKDPYAYLYTYAFSIEPLKNKTSLFFISTDQSSDTTTSTTEASLDYSLWRVDSNTSERLTRLTTQSDSVFNELAANEKKLLWIKTNLMGEQTELWQFDLKTKQTRLILHFPSNKNFPRHLSMTKALFFKNKLYWWFTTISEEGREVDELWTSDFTTKGTKRLVSLPNPNNEYKAAPILFSFADRLYFFLCDGVRPSALWITDGSVEGTKNLLSLEGAQYAGGAGDSWPAYPTPYVLRANKLIFPTFSPKGRAHSQLWSLTPEKPEQPLLLGEFDDPELLRPASNDQGRFVYFLSGKERWQTDGSLEGTKSLGTDPIRQDWQPSPWPTGSLTESLGFGLANSPASWLLPATDTQAGQEPWLITTKPMHSQRLKDINLAPASADLKQVHRLGSTWYFVLGSRLWATEQDPATAHEVTAIPQNESFSFNAQSIVKSGDTLYFITENPEKTNSLWQINAGQAKRIKTYPTGGYIWLFPSHQGVYVAYSPPETTGTWTLELWQAQQQQFSTVLKQGKDQRRLATLLETEQGLLYVLEPNYALGGELGTYSLVLHTQAGAEFILKDKFEPVPSLLTDTLLATTENTYFLTQKENDPLNYQLSRIDWANKKLVEIKLAALPQQSRVLAAKQGLFILSQEPEANLWWLANHAEQTELIKKFAPQQRLELAKVLDDQLYFHLSPLNQDYLIQDEPPRELWLTDGTSAGTQKLQDDLEISGY